MQQAETHSPRSGKGFRDHVVPLLCGVCLASVAYGVTELVPGERVVDERVPQVTLQRSELVFVPFGRDKEPGIPTIPLVQSVLVKGAVGGDGGEGGRLVDSVSQYSQYTFRITDDGEVVIATGGPKPSDRRVYVFDKRGVLRRSFRHQEVCAKTVDLDDADRVLIFVGDCDDVSTRINAQGQIDERFGRYPSLHVTHPFHVAIYGPGDTRRTVELPEISKGEMELTVLRDGWRGRVPYYLNGDVYVGSELKHHLDDAASHRERIPTPRIWNLYAEPDGNAIVLGPSGDIETLRRSKWDKLRRRRTNTTGLRLAVYRLAELGEGDVIRGAGLLGGGAVHSWFVIGASVRPRIGEGYSLFLFLNRRGDVVGQSRIPESDIGNAFIEESDLNGNIYWFDLESGGAGLRIGKWTSLR